MPGMLGWFKMTSEISLADIEWMLARSAAFDAGYAFVTSFEALAENGNSDEILRLLGEWEKARLSGAFDAELKQRMEDLNNEFHLEAVNDNIWQIYQVHSYKFTYDKKVRQPGEPLYGSYSFDNPEKNQQLNLTLTAANGDLENIRLELDNYKEVLLPLTLYTGQILQYQGGDKATIYNSNWQKLKEIVFDSSNFKVTSGSHTLNFECTFSGEGEPQAKLEIRVIGEAEKVNADM